MSLTFSRAFWAQSRWDLACLMWRCGSSATGFASVAGKQQAFCHIACPQGRQSNYNLFWKKEERGWRETQTEKAAYRKWEANVTQVFEQWAAVEGTMREWRFDHKHLMRNDKQVVSGLCLTKNATFHFRKTKEWKLWVFFCLSDEQSGELQQRTLSEHKPPPTLRTLPSKCYSQRHHSHQWKWSWDWFCDLENTPFRFEIKCLPLS